MYKKLKNIISHPSIIGMYLMDRWYQVLGWILAFFMITTLLVAVFDIGRKSLDSNDAVEISDTLVFGGYIDDAKYSNHELSGTFKRVETDYYIVSFNDNGYMNNIRYSGLIFVYGKENMNVYYSGILLGKVNYKDIDVSDFNGEDIINGDVQMRMVFEGFILKSVESAEANYRAIRFFIDFSLIIVYYLITLMACYFVGWMVNPPIVRRIRLKLTAYSTLMYFVFIWFDILYQQSWLSYLGSFVCAVYTIITFSHIRQVRIGRRNNNDDYRGH